MSAERASSAEPYVAPAVLGPEYGGWEAGERPERLYVPAQRGGASGEVGVALRQLTDGRLALLVYTGREQLVDGCGAGQSWIAIMTDDLHEVRYRCGADTVLWDVSLPSHLRDAA